MQIVPAFMVVFMDKVKKIFKMEKNVSTSKPQGGYTMQKKNKENLIYLTLSRSEFANPKIRLAIQEIITQKFNMQKYNDFIKVSKAEFEVIKLAFRGEFVEKAKYNNLTNFKGEAGKMRGKRLIVED